MLATIKSEKFASDRKNHSPASLSSARQLHHRTQKQHFLALELLANKNVKQDFHLEAVSP